MASFYATNISAAKSSCLTCKFKAYLFICLLQGGFIHVFIWKNAIVVLVNSTRLGNMRERLPLIQMFRKKCLNYIINVSAPQCAINAVFM